MFRLPVEPDGVDPTGVGPNGVEPVRRTPSAKDRGAQHLLHNNANPGHLLAISLDCERGKTAMTTPSVTFCRTRVEWETAALPSLSGHPAGTPAARGSALFLLRKPAKSAIESPRGMQSNRKRGAEVRRLGIHSFVWTGGQTQEGLERALEKTAEHGYRTIEFAYLKPEKFDLDRLAKKAQSLDVEIGVTMGLPLSADVSSEDDSVVENGKALLADAVKAVRDIGGNKLGGILYSAHTKYNTMPTERGWKNSAAAIAETGEIAREAGVDLVLEVVNRFETNLLNTTAQGLKFLDDSGSDHVRLHLDTFHMNIEEANPAAAIRLAGDKIGYFHIGESNRGYLGDGVIDFDRIFDALLDINYSRDIVFESFSNTVVDEGLSLACAIWRDTWTQNDPLAEHAKKFIEMKYAEAQRRRASNARP
jgi:D-psicose/D-tagatose/L-ribulose 3-epimerase